jgi:phosphoribosylformylglycinamidine synthase subunit PurQ / glutaminase
MIIGSYMKSAVVVFPGSNCDRDVALALGKITGTAPAMIWHGETQLPSVDLIVLPGGFSYGDYLRSGAMAAHSPIMREVKKSADVGVCVLGICNGFQALTESHLLPGALLRNAGLKFVHRWVELETVATDTPFTRRYNSGQVVRMPIAHGEGNYFADTATLDRLEQESRVVLRYLGDNPNGSARAIAGIRNDRGNVIGLMPHPERAIEPLLGSVDGRAFFESAIEALG